MIHSKAAAILEIVKDEVAPYCEERNYRYLVIPSNGLTLTS